MSIQFLDLRRQYAELDAEINAAMVRVVTSGIYILGSEVEQFERDWAKFCGVAGAAAVASGTEALTLALIGSGAVRKHHGDEVITSPLTSPYTALSIMNAGAIPVFAEIDPRTYILSPDEIEKALTSRTRAIMPVHLYGRMAEMKEISEIAARRNIIVIEDAAHAHGARLAEGGVGTFSHAAAFSFYPTKNLGAFGDGGAVISNDPSLIERVKNLRQGGSTTALRTAMEGRNSRLDELQAAILGVKLKSLERWNLRRQRLARMYTEAFRQSLIKGEASVDQARSHVHHLYVIQHPERDRLKQYLVASGIETMVHYPLLLHQQPLFRRANQRSLPIAEQVVKHILSLPLYPHLQDSEAARVIEVLLQYKSQA